MAQINSESNTPKLPTLTIAQTLIMTAIAVVSSVLFVGMYTGNLQQRVTALEETKSEVGKRLDRIEEKMVDSRSYQQDQNKTAETLSEIKGDVKELRNLLMRK
jgi:Tfp pilus assembly protein PilN